MLSLEADGALSMTFDPSSTVEEVLTAFEEAVDGQPKLHAEYLLQHPKIPLNYFEGALIRDNFGTLLVLPLYAYVYNALEAHFF